MFEKESDGKSGVPRIEVTPEMIQAGASELAGFYWDTDDSIEAARRVFLAMISVHQTAEKTR